MADTRITRLRNLMTPVVNYFAMTKEEGHQRRLEHLIHKEHQKVQEVLPEIIEIIKSIPNDACDLKD